MSTVVPIFLVHGSLFLSKLKMAGAIFFMSYVDNPFLAGEKKCRKKNFFKRAGD